MPPNQQTPSQVPPDPNMPLVQPVRRTVIQPLSPEDDIRQAAASSGAPARSSEPSVNPTGNYVSGVMPTDSAEYKNTYEGSLVTEPVHQVAQAPLQYDDIPQASTSHSIAKIKKPFVIVFAVVLSVLVIGILGIVAWLYFFNRVPASNLAYESANILNRESSTDLIQESFGQSTYLRPEEWSEIPGSATANGYANVRLEDGRPTALISVSEFPESEFLNPTSEEGYAKLRTYYMNEIPDWVLVGAFGASAPMKCDDKTVAITRQEHTTRTKTTIGIADIALSCTKDGGNVRMKMWIVTGLNDGRSRMIVVAATELEWSKNEKTFLQMLGSVEERQAS